MAVRQFVDSAGFAWEVFEVRRQTARSESVSPGLDGGWLTFQRAGEKRRLTGYPESWWSFDDAGLEVLCGSALPAPLSATGVLAPASASVTAPSSAGAGVGDDADSDVASPSLPRGVTDEQVQSLARDTRAAGTPAVQAMIQLKRLLDGAGVETVSPDFKRVRGLFVNAFYFG